MKTPVTIRLDPDLLAAARAEAERDSRTLTNLLELAVRRYLGTASAPVRDAATGPAPRTATIGKPT